MTLEEIAKTLGLNLLTEEKNLSRITPTTGYTSDMLSCVMSGAPKQSIWITLQAHVNIVAVAALLELSAVIITEDAPVDEATTSKANEKGVTLFLTPLSSFEIAGRLWEMGLRSA
jgi:hypothetical protein